MSSRDSSTLPPQPVAPEVAVRITDGLVWAIERDLAPDGPNVGAAIMGVGELAHLLVVDSAEPPRVGLWTVTPELSRVVAAIEAGHHGWFLGTVHNRASGEKSPSPDEVASLVDVLRAHPRLDRLLVGVVSSSAPQAHDVAIEPDSALSMYELRVTSEGQPRLRRAAITVVPLDNDLYGANLSVRASTFTDLWTGPIERDTKTPLATTSMLGDREKLLVRIPSDRPVGLAIDPLHPIAGPVCVRMRDARDGSGTAVPDPLGSPWDPSRASPAQVGRMVRRVAGHGMGGGPQWAAELVGPLTNKRVLIAGIGSVGSRIAEDLVRSGLGAIVLVDPDFVEPANLPRSVYRLDDVGQTKCESLTRRLKSINPDLPIFQIPDGISEVRWGRALKKVDLVIGATDVMRDQAILSDQAYARDIPFIGCVAYRLGAGGEVVLAVPKAETACWSCAVAAPEHGAPSHPEPNYGVRTRLVGGSALGPSINLVASIASQVAIGLLAGRDSIAGEFVAAMVEGRRTMGIISTTAGVGPDALPPAPGEFGLRSVWPVIHPRPECTICGERPVDPAKVRHDAHELDDLERMVWGDDPTVPWPTEGADGVDADGTPRAPGHSA